MGAPPCPNCNCDTSADEWSIVMKDVPLVASSDLLTLIRHRRCRRCIAVHADGEDWRNGLVGHR
jgi:hypothetical protein